MLLIFQNSNIISLLVVKEFLCGFVEWFLTVFLLAMDSRSQQPMINLSGSGRKRNKENQSDASLAGIRQRGSGNALDLFLQRRAESIKRSKTIGTSSEFDKNSRATSQVPLSTIDQSASYQSIRRARLSNFDQNPSPVSVLDSTVTNVMPSTNAATAIGRSPLSRLDQNANHGVLLDSTVTGVKRRGRGPSIETLFNQSKKSSTSAGAGFSPSNLCQGVKRRGRGPSIETLFKQSKKSSTSGATVSPADLCNSTTSSSIHHASCAPVSATVHKRGGRGPGLQLKATSTGALQSGSNLSEVLHTDADRIHSKRDRASISGAKNLEHLFNEAADTDMDQNLPREHLDLWDGYMNLGPPTEQCSKCGACMWMGERNNKSRRTARPTFSLCCRDGMVSLPLEDHPPELLASLLYGGPKTTHFRANIRVYNCMFSMCSSGGKVDHKINNGNAPYCFKIRGENKHLMGSLLPAESDTPKFCQLYIYDTDNEVENRMNSVGSRPDEIDPEIVQSLIRLFDQINHLVKSFRTARERFKSNEQDEFSLILVSSEAASGRKNIIGPSNEVGGLIVNPNGDAPGVRDTIVQSRRNGLERVWETDKHFMPLQFPILFPRGKDGWHPKLPLRNTKRPVVNQDDGAEDDPDKKVREFVSMKEYYCYKLMIRHHEGLTPHLGGRLWQQYIVDAFTPIEQYRLDQISRNQTTIRSDLYNSVRDAVRRGENDPSHVAKCVILPASFTGCKRYMSQYYKDSLALCRSIGHPTLFLTMTCNSKWPEIKEMMQHLPGVDISDAPDVTARVFKQKVDQLIDLIKKQNFFGRCIGLMHVIEFQKRGLPHVHMLIWLNDADKPKNAESIDRIVSAEIPDKDADPVAYSAVCNYMLHGPCGKDATYSPCMVKNKCSKHFPKRQANQDTD
ncbi:uncharacterized protein LOC108203411 isoform X2 [Daucus carota subsp. sativus]|uniref:uncharacterized protein LOC108203411 isoform X2 n=1 Tax=Daucus carota subsp. sativus TaxID=79200 RepID=UPI00308357C3